MRCVLFPFMASAVLVSGCGTTSIPCERPLIPALPAEAAMPCPVLPPLGDPTMGTLAIVHGETIAAYAECQRRQAASVAAYSAAMKTVNGGK
jgi:hypothetical protein